MGRLAYIPARGGSKGVPRKNIMLIAGKPLLVYTIEAAQESGIFDKIMVSTDDEDIANVAKAYGAWVPFLRDPMVSGDTTPTMVSLCSDKDRLEKMGYSFSYVCLLQPTSPLRTSRDIVNACALYDEKHAGVSSVCQVEEHPYFMRTIDGDGRLGFTVPFKGAIRRQDLPTYYRINGAIFINSWEELAPDLPQAGNPYGYVMSQESSIDIDTEKDVRLAEEILLSRKSQR